jgi:hypothetical protein
LESLDKAIRWGESRLIANNRYLLACIYKATGRFPSALQMACEAVTLYERLGLPNKVAQVEELLRHLPEKEEL